MLADLNQPEFANLRRRPSAIGAQFVLFGATEQIRARADEATPLELGGANGGVGPDVDAGLDLGLPMEDQTAKSDETVQRAPFQREPIERPSQVHSRMSRQQGEHLRPEAEDRFSRSGQPLFHPACGRRRQDQHEGRDVGHHLEDMNDRVWLLAHDPALSIPGGCPWPGSPLRTRLNRAEWMASSVSRTRAGIL